MPSYTTERRVNHSADEMFALVADVETYPEFVPLCQKLKVRGRKMDGSREILIADMTVAYKFIHETFTTKVVLDRGQSTIGADYIEGPFKHLENLWSFSAIDAEHSIVRFSIDYEFRSRMLSTLMGAVFDKAFRKFADAFEKRADAVYGTDGAPAALQRFT